MTPRSWLNETKRRLRAGGSSSAEHDSRLLLEHVTGLGALDLLRHPLMVLDDEALHRLNEAVNRRLLHEPVSRIVGKREFFGRPFQVTPATLDPRPETETLIEATMEVVSREGWHDRQLRILDIGTGTGCIAITLLAELPAAQVVATDISPEAIEVARENAERHDVAGRLELRLSDCLDDVQGQFDLVVSNPPYIPTRTIDRLELGVRDYDPRTALDGGSDGLSFYRRIFRDIFNYLPNGWLVMEIGFDQVADVAAIGRDHFGDNLRKDWCTWRDLGAQDRVVAFRTRR